jgi:hypothetical protein
MLKTTKMNTLLLLLMLFCYETKAEGPGINSSNSDCCTNNTRTRVRRQFAGVREASESIRISQRCRNSKSVSYDEREAKFYDDAPVRVSRQLSCNSGECQVASTEGVSRADTFTKDYTQAWNGDIGGEILDAINIKLGYSRSVSWSYSTTETTMNSETYTCRAAPGSTVWIEFIAEYQISKGVLKTRYPSECLTRDFPAKDEEVTIKSYGKRHGRLSGSMQCEHSGNGGDNGSNGRNYYCKANYDNTCVSNSDCCSKNCWKENSNWATGVCKPGSQSSTTCKANGDNTCGSHSDCCSRNCWKGNSDWASGVCKP